jgi:hypothetical protein
MGFCAEGTGLMIVIFRSETSVVSGLSRVLYLHTHLKRLGVRPPESAKVSRCVINIQLLCLFYQLPNVHIVVVQMNSYLC